MIDTETQELLDTAPLLRDDGNDTIVAFLNFELDMSRTFAKRAWSLCATNHLAAANLQGIAAIDAYDRELLNVKLGIVTPMIERLATIT